MINKLFSSSRKFGLVDKAYISEDAPIKIPFSVGERKLKFGILIWMSQNTEVRRGLNSAPFATERNGEYL
jgi:hypothetical protein